MNDNNANKKKKSDHTSNYVKTFRQGSIAANVFQRTAPGGFEYLDFNLSRAWKTSGGKEGYSQQYFSRNRQALQVVVDEACDYIDANTPELSEDRPDTEADQSVKCA